MQWGGLNKTTPHNAVLITNYRNTTDECLEIYYSIAATSALYIKTRNETLIQKLERKLDASHPAKWSREFVTLPFGLNQVIIEGERTSGRILIDDIVIDSCKAFGE